jgi:peptide/nickel transport system substrate-binding protein
MSNPRTDALIEQALKTVDRAGREKLFSEAIGIAVKDVGIAPLYFEVYAWASRAGLETTPRLDGLNLAESVSAK